MTDTAEYWNDVKGNWRHKTVFIHIKGFDCGHYHVQESKKLDQVDCYACLKHIDDDPELKDQLQKIKDNREKQHRINKGYKLKSIIKFGKYRGKNTTLIWIIENDLGYFKWMIGKILFHPEVDKYL